MRTPRNTLLIALLLLPVGAASADHYHYGVAADEFLGDNDRLWSALSRYPEWSSSRNLLRDDLIANDNDRSSGDSMYDDLTWYADNLQAGDVLMFSYWGHGGWNYTEYGSADEGSTARPEENDPDPGADPPYAGDEAFGWTGHSSTMRDDHLTDIFAAFDPGVTVVVISGACHSGGWVGGSHDIDTSAPATNNGLYALLGAPEQGLGIGVGVSEDEAELLLATALVETLEAHMTMSAWYEAAMDFGESSQFYVKYPWESSPDYYYFWPGADWIPSEYEKTYFSSTGHWGWQETYLQLRPEEHSFLDGSHDFTVGTPEPATVLMVAAGIVAVACRRRVTGCRLRKSA
ncbi:MAG: PEP-CTERM sorting domain-containing protein [Armatimonadota bacterium]